MSSPRQAQARRHGFETGALRRSLADGADDRPLAGAGTGHQGPAASRAARANGTPSALAIAPFSRGPTSVLASADTSASVSGAALRAPSTSQPVTMTGSAGG